MSNVSAFCTVFTGFSPEAINPESRDKLIKSMEDLVSKAEDEKRELNAEEKKAFDFAFHLLKQTGTDKYEWNSRASTDGTTIQTSRLDTGFIGAKYADLFPNVRLDWGPYKGAEDVLRKAAEKRTMVEGIGVFGGFAVPGQMAAEIYNLAVESSIALPRCRVFPMNTVSLDVPCWDSGDHTNGPIGAFRCSWLGEAQTATKVNPRLRAVRLEAEKLACYLDASSELVSDMPMSAQIGFIMRQSISYGIDEAVINANGVGKPTGIMHASSRISVNRTTVNDITYPDLVAMLTRLVPSLIPGAIWICSPAAYARLLLMVDTGNHYVWVPTSYAGAAATPPQSILGLPLFVSEKCSNLGTEGDIILCNLSAYALGIRQEISLETSNTPGWQEGLVSYRIIVRVDGVPLLNAPITPAYNGPSLSWAVTLGS